MIQDLENLQQRHEFLRIKLTNKKPLEEKIKVLENSKQRALVKLQKVDEQCKRATAIYNAVQEKIQAFDAELCVLL